MLCVSDGKEPDYMQLLPSAWIFDILAKCCDKVRNYFKLELFSFIGKYSLTFHNFSSNQHFQWDLKSCLEEPSDLFLSAITPCSSNGIVLTTSQEQMVVITLTGLEEITVSVMEMTHNTRRTGLWLGALIPWNIAVCIITHGL